MYSLNKGFNLTMLPPFCIHRAGLQKELPQGGERIRGVTSPYGFLRVRLAANPDGHGHRQSGQLLAKPDGFLRVPAAQSFAQAKGKVLGCVNNTGAWLTKQNTPGIKHTEVISNIWNERVSTQACCRSSRSRTGTNVKSGLTLLQLGRCVLASHRYIGNDELDCVSNERVAKRQVPSVYRRETFVVDRLWPISPDCKEKTAPRKRNSLVKMTAVRCLVLCTVAIYPGAFTE